MTGSPVSERYASTPNADGAQRREREVALGRGRAQARDGHQDERPDRDSGQQRPVDERQVRGDLLRGHRGSVAAPRATPCRGRAA